MIEEKQIITNLEKYFHKYYNTRKSTYENFDQDSQLIATFMKNSLIYGKSYHDVGCTYGCLFQQYFLDEITTKYPNKKYDIFTVIFFIIPEERVYTPNMYPILDPDKEELNYPKIGKTKRYLILGKTTLMIAAAYENIDSKEYDFYIGMKRSNLEQVDTYKDYMMHRNIMCLHYQIGVELTKITKLCKHCQQKIEKLFQKLYNKSLSSFLLSKSNLTL